MKNIITSLLLTTTLIVLGACSRQSKKPKNNRNTNDLVTHYSKHIKSIKPKSASVNHNQINYTINYDELTSDENDIYNILKPKLIVGSTIYFQSQKTKVDNDSLYEIVNVSNFPLVKDSCSARISNIEIKNGKITVAYKSIFNRWVKKRINRNYYKIQLTLSDLTSITVIYRQHEQILDHNYKIDNNTYMIGDTPFYLWCNSDGYPHIIKNNFDHDHNTPNNLLCD